MLTVLLHGPLTELVYPPLPPTSCRSNNLAIVIARITHHHVPLALTSLHPDLARTQLLPLLIANATVRRYNY